VSLVVASWSYLVSFRWILVDSALFTFSDNFGLSTLALPDEDRPEYFGLFSFSE
jgi:hypothetical protein